MKGLNLKYHSCFPMYIFSPCNILFLLQKNSLRADIISNQIALVDLFLA